MTLINELYGGKREDIVMDKLQRGLNRKIYKTRYKFSPFDFYDDKMNIYELKSRCIKITDYDTALISVHKIRNNRNYRNLFFLYEYIKTDSIDATDKELYYIKYDYELFNTFYKDDYENTYHIPTSLLRNFNSKESNIFNPHTTPQLEVQFNILISTDYRNSLIYGNKTIKTN